VDSRGVVSRLDDGGVGRTPLTINRRKGWLIRYGRRKESEGVESRRMGSMIRVGKSEDNNCERMVAGCSSGRGFFFFASP
jgi:hypothetical protein